MPDWAVQVVAMVLTGVVTAGGVYAAIRADIAYMRAKVEQAADSAAEAHRRIDGFFQHGRA